MAYRTYGLPDFSNSHRIPIEAPEDGLEIVAEGPAVEHAEDAEAVAVEKMAELAQ